MINTLIALAGTLILCIIAKYLGGNISAVESMIIYYILALNFKLDDVWEKVK